MRAQAKIQILVLLLAFAHGMAKTPEELFQEGDYLQALKGRQALNLTELAQTKKIPRDFALADSPMWEIESQKELAALALFEKGFQHWMKNDRKGAIDAWLESQKQILAESPEAKRYYRRTQLAILRASWSDFPSDGDRLEAILNAALVIQDLPLPERAWDFAFQLGADQQITTIAEYAKVLPNLTEANFVSALMQKQAEIRRNRKLGELLRKSPPNAEPTYESLTDRLLFESFEKTLSAFFDEYLQSPSGGGAFIGGNRDHFRLIRALLALDLPESDAFPAALNFWLENQASPQSETINDVLISLLGNAVASGDPEHVTRILKGVAPYWDRMEWKDDAFRMRVSRLLKEHGDCARAAKLWEASVAQTRDASARAQKLISLVEIKLCANDFTGALANAQQALSLLGSNPPLQLHRMMATACINLKRHAEAVGYLQKFTAASLEENEKIEAQYLIGWLYSLDQKFDLARASFKMVIESHPDSPFAKKCRDYLRALPRGNK